MSGPLDELYQEVILDHYKHPRCHGCLSAPQAQSSLYNPLCGDHITIELTVENGRVAQIAFSGKGCSISQAAASMMSSICEGQSIVEVEKFLNKFRALMRGEVGQSECAELGDAVALEGVRKFSARVKCAMLAWEALERCLSEVQ